MAIAVRTGSANSATSGTTVLAPSGTGTVNVTAGDWIVGVFLLNPSTANLSSIAVSGGTATIGTPTYKTKVTNGAVVGVTLFYVKVTGTGTLRLVATADGTITSAVLAWEAYSGASSVNAPTVTSNTGTGVDLHATLTAGYDGSWIIQVGGKHATGAITNGSNAGETHSTVEQGTSANPSGTTNDLYAAVGSPQSTTTATTAYTVDFTGTTGDVYASDAVELRAISSAVTTGAGSESASSSETVSANLKAVTVTESAAGVARVATNLKAVGVSEGATSSAKANANTTASGGQSGSGVALVTANKKGVTVTQSASVSAKVTTNLKGVSVTQAGAGVAKVSANKTSVTEIESATASARITTNKKAVTIMMAASAFAVAYNPGGGVIPALEAIDRIDQLDMLT